LIATHGIVGPKKQFFEEAFGNNEIEFLEILSLPEDYIIYRRAHIVNGDRAKLKTMIDRLTKQQKAALDQIILHDSVTTSNIENKDKKLAEILKCYLHNQGFG
jgi:hypothetical protein